MSSITKPFDLLFKHTMGSDVALKDFLRAHLPKSLKGRIDLESIHPTKQSYVSAELRELHSDLVCTCKIDGKEALLYLIIEHQSKEVWIMPLRFIKYKATLIEDYLSGKPSGTPWPIVVCCCFYHGEKSPYPYPTDVYSYFEDPILARELGTFQNFHLIDLTIEDDAQMQQHDSLALMERILKYSRNRDFFNTLSSLLKEYKASLLSLESPLGDDYWYAVYLVSVNLLSKHGHSEEEVAALFADSLDLGQTKEGIMSIRQTLRQEALQEGIQQGIQEGMQQGMQEGMQQGMQQEKLGIAKEMLRKGYSSDAVKELTGLSRAELKKLQGEQ